MDFVTFKIAKKLKEKGFPQNSIGKYTMKDACYVEDGSFWENGCIAEVATSYTCPTISQVLKWLRDKNIICLPHIDPGKEKWFFFITILPQPCDFPVHMSSIIYNNYEEATLAGIEYVLDNLI